MKYAHKLLILHIIATISFAGQLFFGNINDWMLTSLVYIVVAISLTMTYHRHLAHKGFEFKNEFVRKLFISICSICSGFSSPIVWVAIHREHHRFSDTEQDPHLGTKLRYLPKLHFTSFFIEPKLKYAVDIARDPLCRFLHNHYFKLHVLYALILFLINPWLVITFYLTPVFLLWHAGNLVNSISHLYGYKNFETKDNSRNNWFVALTFFGEWHNNHHYNPRNPKHGFKWYEIDITYNIIRLLGKDLQH